MENKQPKEVWIGVYEDVKFFASNRPQVIMLPITNTKLAVHNPIKYISSTHHNEIVEGLKEGIRKLQEQFDENGGNLPPLIQLQRISANVSDIIKNYFEENKLLKAEIESLKAEKQMQENLFRNANREEV